MIELEPAIHHRVLPLYSCAALDFPLIRAVIQGRQSGSVFVDDDESPGMALVANRFGFTYAFARAHDDESTRGLMDWLFEASPLKGRYLLWYAPPESCRRRMDALPDGIARQRTRVRFRLNPERFLSTRKPEQDGRERPRVVRIDGRLLPGLQPFDLDIGSRFWDSETAFLRDGFGFAATTGDIVASVCYAACVANNVAEIDVATRPEFRGRGFARLVSRAFIDHALRADVTPSWDCFEYNEASCRLAIALGFQETCRYPFYSVNV